MCQRPNRILLPVVQVRQLAAYFLLELVRHAIPQQGDPARYSGLVADVAVFEPRSHVSPVEKGFELTSLTSRERELV